MARTLVILVILSISICSVTPASLRDYANSVITHFQSSFEPFRGYSFGYETSDGQGRQETANIEPMNEGEAPGTVAGTHNYMGDGGKNSKVEIQGKHVADARIPPAAIATLAGGGLG